MAQTVELEGCLVWNMEKKRMLLTDSASSSGWLSFGLAASILVIFLTAASEQYPAFYCSALIQLVNCLATYLGVSRKKYGRTISIVAGVEKVILAVAAFGCIAYFYLLSNTPTETVDAYKLYEFLNSTTATYIISFLLATCFVEYGVEYIIHICLPEASKN